MDKLFCLLFSTNKLIISMGWIINYALIYAIHLFMVSYFQTSYMSDQSVLVSWLLIFLQANYICFLFSIFSLVFVLLYFYSLCKEIFPTDDQSNMLFGCLCSIIHDIIFYFRILLINDVVSTSCRITYVARSLSFLSICTFRCIEILDLQNKIRFTKYEISGIRTYPVFIYKTYVNIQNKVKWNILIF